MKDDQLKKGTELQGHIKELKSHIDTVRNHGDLVRTPYPSDISSKSLIMYWDGNRSSGNEIRLWDMFLGWDEFKELYLMRAEKKLYELQAEYEAL